MGEKLNPKALKSSTGQPIHGDDGFLLDHYRSFAAVFNAFTRSYRWTSDEAMKHSRENALAMRRDVFLMGCLQERKLAVAHLPWHIEPEDQKDQLQIDTAAMLTDVVRRTPRLTMQLMNLLDATWYGKYGSQVVIGQAEIGGEVRRVVTKHRPVNGDKIQFTWEGTPRVMVNSMASGELADKGANLIQGERSMELVLDKPFFRDRFVIHTHETDDADYFEGEMAGTVQGVGLRSRIYWAYWLRDEMLSWAINYMEKVGTLGLLLFYYESGNAKAKAAAETAAQESSTRTAFAVPLPPGANKSAAGVDQVSTATAGIEMLCTMIADYFERHIERYIIGQSLSSKAESTGLGSSVADLHEDTKFRIVKGDAESLAETLTSDLVRPLHTLNAPEVRAQMRFVFDVPVPDAKDRLEAASKLHSMGVACKVDELRAFAGLSRPDDDDEVTQPTAGQLPDDDPDNHGAPLAREVTAAGNGKDRSESQDKEPTE